MKIKKTNSSEEACSRHKRKVSGMMKATRPLGYTIENFPNI